MGKWKQEWGNGGGESKKESKSRRAKEQKSRNGKGWKM